MNPYSRFHVPEAWILPSVSDSEAVKIAVDFCNNEKFKRIILYPPHTKISISCSMSSSLTMTKEGLKNWKMQWDVDVEKEVNNLLKNYSLNKEAKEKVKGAAFPIALRMLTWAEFYMAVFDLSRDFCFDFLSKDLFSAEGIIMEEKVAEKLKNSKELNNKQLFQVACYYCDTEKIPIAFSRLKKKEKEFFISEGQRKVNQVLIIQFWSHYLMGEIDGLRGHKSIDKYRLKCAISSGSKQAVEFCLKKTGLVKRKHSVVDTCLEVVKFRFVCEVRKNRINLRDDYVVFRNKSYNPSEELWVPGYCLADIFYSLLEKMTENEKRGMIKDFFRLLKYHKVVCDFPLHIKYFEYFLVWPYQSQFMEFIKYALPYLKNRSYCVLLLDVCGRIEPDKGTLWYGENYSCDYRKMLASLWQRAANEAIRYSFDYKKIALGETKRKLNEAEELICDLFFHENFTLEDKNIIKLILSSADELEKEGVLSSEAGKLICEYLIKEEKWDLFDEFLLMCVDGTEKALSYRKAYGFWGVQEKCYDFIPDERWTEAEKFMKWCCLSEKDQKGLKRGVIWNLKGKVACLGLFLKDVAAADRFVEWCLPSEEDAKVFKYYLLLTDKKGLDFCEDLVVHGYISLLDKLIHWCLDCEKEEKKFKRCFIKDVGYSICSRIFLKCKRSISGLTFKSNDKTELRLADEFISWSFPKKDDASVFKASYFRCCGGRVYYELVKYNRCFEAIRLFSWSELPSDEIKKLRKYILFDNSATCVLFDEMMAAKDNDRRYANCGGRRNAIEQILKWCLIDKQTLVEFKARYRCYRKDYLIRRIVAQLEERFDAADEAIQQQENVKKRAIFLK